MKTPQNSYKHSRISQNVPQPSRTFLKTTECIRTPQNVPNMQEDLRMVKNFQKPFRSLSELLWRYLKALECLIIHQNVKRGPQKAQNLSILRNTNDIPIHFGNLLETLTLVIIAPYSSKTRWTSENAPELSATFHRYLDILERVRASKKARTSKNWFKPSVAF